MYNILVHLVQNFLFVVTVVVFVVPASAPTPSVDQHHHQQPSLSHASCRTPTVTPLIQWLVRDAHYARGYARLVG